MLKTERPRPVTLSLPPDLDKLLVDLALAERESRSAIACRLLRRGLQVEQAEKPQRDPAGHR
jgi:predicted transcriptional regulator